MNKIKLKINLMNMIVKIICWLWFVIGLGLSIFAIAELIINIKDIKTQINDSLLYINFNDINSAVVWTSDFSNFFKTANTSFSLLLIGALIMFLARISSKPLLAFGTLFSWNSEDNIEFKRNFKKQLVVSITFLSLSLILAILTLAGIYKLLLSTQTIFQESQLIIDNGIIKIQGLDPNSTADQINNQVNLIITTVNQQINNLTPKIIIDQNLPMFILAVVALLNWGIIELIHGIIVQVEIKQTF